MSAIIDFENLSLIPKLLEKIEVLEMELKQIKGIVVPEYDLTKRDDVKKYLGISDRTLINMMQDGRMREGIHFTREINGKKTKINFVSGAIENLKG